MTDYSAKPVDAILHQIHRNPGEGKNTLENQRHDREEDQHAPNLVRYDPVQLVTEGLGHGEVCRGHGLRDIGDAAIARFNGGAAPIDRRFFQAQSGSLDRARNALGIMLAAGSRELLVAENQDCFGHGLETRSRKSGLKQFGQSCRLAAQAERQFAERLGFDSIVSSQHRRFDFFAQLGHTLSGAGHGWEYWDAQGSAEMGRVNLMPILLRHVDHVQGDEGRIAQLDHLRGKIKVALEIRRIDHHDDQLGRRHFRQTMKQHVARNLLVERLRAKAVGARQIEHDDGLRL